MSKLKDKLSANMRTIQRTETPDAQPTVVKATSNDGAAPAAPPTRGAGAQSARQPSGHTTHPGFDIPTHSTALHPARVWPD